MELEFNDAYSDHVEKIDERYRTDTWRPIAFPRLSDTQPRFAMKPTSPREAMDQSVDYLADVKETDEILLHNAKVGLLNARTRSENALVEAEATSTFSRNFKTALGEINTEEDPDIRRTLWEDLLAFRTHYSQPHFVWGATNHIYSGKSALENDFSHTTLLDARYDLAVGVYGSVQEAKEGRPGFLYDFVGNVAEAAQQDPSKRLDIREWYEKLLRNPFVATLNYPNYDAVSPAVWEKLEAHIDVLREFVQYDGQRPISEALSDQLTSRISDYLKSADTYSTWSDERVAKFKADAAMTDEYIEEKSQEDFEAQENPFIKEAHEHAQQNLTLLRRAAIAEAALDGVRIKTRGSHKTSE